MTSGTTVGFDVSGTFTDLIAFDPQAGTVRLAKTPSTPGNEAEGVLATADRIAFLANGAVAETLPTAALAPAALAPDAQAFCTWVGV